MKIVLLLLETDEQIPWLNNDNSWQLGGKRMTANRSRCHGGR